MAEREPHPARVPGAEDAVADDAKFRDYLLNRHHPRGGPKAAFFRAIGWPLERWEELRDFLLAQLPYVEGRFSRENEFLEGAALYEAVIEVPRDNGDFVPVGTYWEVHPGHATRFLTAYPA